MTQVMQRWMAVLCVIVLWAVAAAPQAAPSSPQRAVDELLAADRGFSAASAKTTVVPGLSAMFAPGVIMPLPGGEFATGAGTVVKALAANPANTTGRVEWTPIRGGISADGAQGFTFGFMTLHNADGTTAPLKYMTYWVKSADGWRAVAYKRARRPEGPVSLALMPPSLPMKMVAPVAITGAVRQELVAAEQAFSDEAQKIGLGPAFAQFGLPDAVNFGGVANANYVVGATAIAALVGAGQPATGGPVSWRCDTAIVASSGDLGVSIGLIHPNAPRPDGTTTPTPFFTIWRKVNGAWKYIAE